MILSGYFQEFLKNTDLTQAWSFIACVTFAFLLHGIKKTRHITTDDIRGINWFILAFVIWAGFGLFDFLFRYIINPKSVDYKLIMSFVSIANSIFFLKAVSYIDVKTDYSYKSFIKFITSDKFQVLFGIAMVLMTLCLYLANYFIKAEYRDSGKLLLQIPEHLISLVAISALAIVTRQAFRERKMRQYQWFIYIILFFLTVNILASFYESTNEPVIFFIKSISKICYKSFLSILILLLLYSYQIVCDDQAKTQLTTVMDGMNEHTKVLTEELMKKDKLIADLELNNQKYAGIKNILDNSQVLHNIPASVKFYITGKNFGFIIYTLLENNEINIDCTLKKAAFLRFFRLAVCKKYGTTQEQQTLPYGDEGNAYKSRNTENAEEAYLLQFRYKDKSELKKLVATSYPNLIEFLFEEFPGETIVKGESPKNSRARIGLNFSPGKIDLPELHIQEGKSPEEIYKKYAEKFDILL